MVRLACLGFLLLAACGMVRAEDFPVDQVVPRVATLASPDQQYALYLPPGYSPGQPWPVLIMLDPRGRAEPTLARVREGARRNGWIVMSSYQSRSDTLESITLFALQALLDESEKRFSTDRRRLYLAGMSGTAKTLWKVVKPLKGSLAGMIGCAGGYSPELPPLSSAAPAFYGCTGTHDFNHREMKDLESTLDKLGSPQYLLEFEGGHGWPEAGLDHAIDWLQLSAMQTGLAPADKQWIAGQFSAALQAALAAPDDFRRGRALQRVAADFRGLHDIGDTAELSATLLGSPEARASKAREALLREDERKYAGLVNDWFTRMRARFPDGRPQDPPPKPQSLAALKVRSLQKLAAGSDRELADSAIRRLELAFAAANSYLPAEAMQRNEPGIAAASRAVAAAIFPDRATRSQ
jgi:predicted esterase